MPKKLQAEEVVYFPKKEEDKKVGDYCVGKLRNIEKRTRLTEDGGSRDEIYAILETGAKPIAIKLNAVSQKIFTDDIKVGDRVLAIFLGMQKMVGDKTRKFNKIFFYALEDENDLEIAEFVESEVKDDALNA